MNPEESFAARTERRGECIIWTGWKNREGYGYIAVGGKDMFAHRYAWERVNGPIPEGMKLDHRDHCNPACVNVEHLRLATNAENTANRSGALSRSSTGARNVIPRGDKFRVAIRKLGHCYYFGTYSTVEEAARAAEEGRRELFGEFAGRG